MSIDSRTSSIFPPTPKKYMPSFPRLTSHDGKPDGGVAVELAQPLANGPKPTLASQSTCCGAARHCGLSLQPRN